MKKTIFFIAALALMMMSCDQQQTPTTTAQPVTLSNYDMVIMEDGQLVFYNNTSGERLPFTAETDSVVNAVYDSHNTLYYSVSRDKALSLKCLKLDEPDAKPVELADWNLTLDDCQSFIYPLGNLLLNEDESEVAIQSNPIAIYKTFGDKVVYNTKTKTVTKETEMSFDEETGNVESNEIEFVAKSMSEVNDSLFEDGEKGALYYLGGSEERVCLTDKLDFLAMFAKTQEELDDEAVISLPKSVNPQGTKVMFCTVIPDGIFTHGPYNVANLDGSNQCTLKTDIEFGLPTWLKDGSLVFVRFDGGPGDDYALEKLHLSVMNPEGAIKDLSASMNYAVKPF